MVHNYNKLKIGKFYVMAVWTTTFTTTTVTLALSWNQRSCDIFWVLQKHKLRQGPFGLHYQCIVFPLSICSFFFLWYCHFFSLCIYLNVQSNKCIFFLSFFLFSLPKIIIKVAWVLGGIHGVISAVILFVPKLRLVWLL
jgi:hypothetical protein